MLLTTLKLKSIKEISIKKFILSLAFLRMISYNNATNNTQAKIY